MPVQSPPSWASDYTIRRPRRPGRIRRIAVSGSSTWPMRLPGWREIVTDALDDQLRRLTAGDTLIIRHGDASKGVDRIASQWVEANLKVAFLAGITLAEETVPADWEHCAPTCRPEHRRVNAKGIRGAGKTFCPSAGHRRNPDIPTHPDYPVDLLLAFCLNNSPGTSKTVEYARRAEVNHRTWHAYRKPKPRAAAVPAAAVGVRDAA
ncbi:hypothetical protein AB0395_22230 [Streptosporangium sp. NPDC051023]|uniref:hypothetical protein n=1 Tax=Streptosporangium sp. NPDC051023 TaxID=3155410 RepID=UPI00345070A0